MVTCGQDRALIFYSFEENCILKIIQPAHDTCLLKIASIEGYGGYLVTCAYDIYVKVWQPADVYG